MKSFTRMAAMALVATTCVVAVAKEPTVKVFILAGQSNMEGHGKVEYGRNPDFDPNTKGSPQEIKGGLGGLRYLATHPDTVAKYRHLLDADGNWIVRNDVWVYTTTPGREKGPLTVGYGKGAWFGPEFAFGHVL
ncbi:MAG: hypothetical protein KDC38_21720, partial [Planctomycetes bacterium]|nr:hypothetical protein [Planctomycetota bacterium]